VTARVGPIHKFDRAFGRNAEETTAQITRSKHIKFPLRLARKMRKLLITPSYPQKATSRMFTTTEIIQHYSCYIPSTLLQFTLLADSSVNLSAWKHYRVGQKSKLLILRKYVNKTEKIGGLWTNKNSHRESEVLSDIFTWNILCHNCIVFKYSTSTTKSNQ